MDIFIENSIKDRLKKKWTETPVEFENELFTRKSGVAYIRPQIEISSTQSAGIFKQEGVSRRKVNATGFILISVFVPLKEGTARISRFCEELKNIMSFWTNGPLECGKGITKRIGKRPEWYQRNVVIDFNYQGCEEV